MLLRVLLMLKLWMNIPELWGMTAQLRLLKVGADVSLHKWRQSMRPTDRRTLPEVCNLLGGKHADPKFTRMPNLQ